MNPQTRRPGTYPKSERLRLKNLTDPLFRHGKSFFEYPLRVVYRCVGDEELDAAFHIPVPGGIAALQMMVTVPKKKRRHAVDRVLMRRRIREAWRLRRRPLREAVEAASGIRTLSVAIIYSAETNVSSDKIHVKVERAVAKLMEKVNAPVSDKHAGGAGDSPENE